MFQSKSNYFVIVNSNKKAGKSTTRGSAHNKKELDLKKSPDPHRNDMEDKIKEMEELRQLEEDLSDLYEKMTIV
jgi:DNA polymerase sigma